MEFNKAYNRQEFVHFLQHSFLPDDFVPTEEPVTFYSKMTYSTQAVKLGTSAGLDLVVYEVRHTSKNDARVSLSKEAFRMLADETVVRALVIFVPEDNNDNYRFSLIEITLEGKDDSARVTRNYSNPHRYSYFLGKGIAYYTPNKYLNEKGRVANADDLRSRFSVEVLTKEFYNELSDWYAWAIKIIRFPNDLNDKTDDDKYNNESAIRLITRLIFVWFLKQRHLIPDEFFDERYIADNLIDGFNPHAMVDLFSKSNESKYYKAILQNLFFAMLNSPITPEGSNELSERHFRKGRSDYDNNKLMRYECFFKNPQLFVDLANKIVPFLNGGLFDCLDEKDKDLYYDSFTDRKDVSKYLIVPDYLFFGEEAGKNIDLSEWYGDKKKKKVSARGIIDILKRYNFTVEENTPFDQEVSLDPELLGKVFENLLASFNPETQTTARKQTGSFYTPREIVQYMVDESLVAHLKRIVGEDLEAEYRKLISYADEEVYLSDEQKQRVIEAIYHCKVLDPACGSGAFPVGMLQQMVHILSQLDPKNEQWKKIMLNEAVNESRNAFLVDSKEEREERLKDIENSFDESMNNPDYARKLYLIENCIYGVDLQPIAIQISKLRFFISLVVDQKTNSDPVQNFGIRPLPNLEAKFVAANTLIPINKTNGKLGRTTEVIAIENKLKEANHKIFSARTRRTKKRWKERVIELRQELADRLVCDGFLTNDAANQVTSWDMFDQNTSASFFDADWMFGVKNGFDIVIGNPPYVQLQNGGGELAVLYANYGFKTFARTGDIYCLFYECGQHLLNNGGHLCYITSNKWMRAGYGEKTRDFFAKNTNPLLLIDFAGIKIFESATVDTNILLFSKSTNMHKTWCAVTNKQNKDSIKNLSVFVQQKGMECDFSNSDSWVILSPIEQSIKRKIEAVGIPLKNWNVQINYGIKTGFNDAFIINTEKRKEILANCQMEDERTRTDELIRPILRGRDIKRYGYEWANLYLIATFPSRHYDIEQYPAVKRHFLSFGKERLEQTGKTCIINGERIKARKKTNNKWFETQDSINYWEDFFKPKLVYAELARTGNAFTFDTNKNIIGNTGYILTVPDNDKDTLLYLLAFLNSRITLYCLNQISSRFDENGWRWLRQFVEQLRVPMFVNKNDIIAEIRKTNKENQQEESEIINAIIASIYHLTQEEEAYINEQLAKY